MKDEDSNDSIRMSRRDLLWMGTAASLGAVFSRAHRLRSARLRRNSAQTTRPPTCHDRTHPNTVSAWARRC